MLNGISEIDKIILLAENKIKDNQVELNSIEKRKSELKDENKDLQSVIFNFVKKSKSQQKDVIDTKVNFTDLELKYQDLIVKILKLFNPKQMIYLARQIIDRVGNLSENQIAYNCLLWLEEKKILARDNDGAYARGKNWKLSEQIGNEK